MKKNIAIRVSGRWVFNRGGRDLKRFVRPETAKAWIKKHYPKAYEQKLYSIHNLGQG